MPSSDAQPRGLHAEHALLAEGWARDVDLLIDAEGIIREVRPDVRRSRLERVEGPVVPGMPNTHSHAFQRLLAGRTNELHGADDFWSWREAMYRLVEAVGPEELAAVSAWVYADMVAAGYTAVAEFHYLFNDRDGHPYQDPAELPRRVALAAAEAGIGLTLVPVLYRRSGFEGGSLSGGARRFALDPDAYVGLIERLDTELAPGGVRIGVGPHSLRAVDPEDLAALLAWSSGGPPRPHHIHVAEQTAEVDGCIRATGMRPVEWLLDLASPGPDWTVVHATHMTRDECDRLAGTRATVGLCPTTEADLGDGVFPIARWIESGGAFGIGSDSNARISPSDELRLSAYTSRLLALRRGSLPLDPARPVGAQLWEIAARGGAAALGQPVGTLEEGKRADLLVLDGARPLLQGLAPDRALDAFVFSGDRRDIARTVVGGRTLARQGRHNEWSRLEADATRAAREVAGRL